MDADGPEHAWAISNSLAGSTKKMGPGLHRDMLDEHFGDWNWRKTINLSSYLIDCAEEALENRPIQVEALKNLSKNIKPEFVEEWADAKMAWELDNTKPNPFILKLELALEEEECTKKDFGKKAIKTTVSATTLIAEGLDLEEVIQHFKWDSEHQSLHLTDLQKARLSDRGFSILSQMDAFFEAHPQTWQNVLQSPTGYRMHLLARTGLIAYKLKYLHGQYNGTKSSQTVNAISSKIDVCAARYRASFAVVEKYAGKVGRVASELQKLCLEDIRRIEWDALNDEREMDVMLSWIWCATGVDKEDDEAIHDSLRITWCKASARAHQWQEGCLLIQEEMQRSLATLEKQVL
ncbi:hypothetical protein BT96DRAFT_1008550 [Gymnopus androsaceus JB14]|uniref:Uncharacterized protein n=1 Tax=Gymnopus androsaceus JB14 TaxID=1447944 RepID=A0A6A4GEW7_9AGAR|nr:hypothetical protein BT96DRAFT_1008550 [Gymnopus androsaceus JB14]